MFSATPVQTTTAFNCGGSSFIVIPDDTDTETESEITMTPEIKDELNISRRDRDDKTGVSRDSFVGIRDSGSRNSADAASTAAQRVQMRRGRALGSEYSWHQHTFELAVDEQLPKASSLLLLGRTPSGCDYAKNIEEEDAATFISDSSSYCARPSRMQMIHRTIPTLFQDEERDTEDLPNTEKDADQNTEFPPTAVTLPPAVLIRDDSRDESPKPQTTKSDMHQRGGLIRGGNAQQQQQQNIGSYQFKTDTSQGRIVFGPPGKYHNLSTEQDWLELELEPENSPDACFCMGYSLLDFLVPEATTSRRRGQRSRTGKHRLPRSTLPLNTVEETAEEGGADVSYSKVSPRVAATRRKSELSTAPMQQKKDPVGDYEDPVGIYSSIV